MSSKLYVGNLSYSMRDNDLELEFSPYGSVQSAKVMMDRDTNRSKGFGFVEMSSAAEAEAAGLFIKNPDGSPVLVQFWDTSQRALAAWLLAGLWLVACGAVLAVLLSMARKTRSAFALTRRELAQDWRVIKEQL